MSSIIVALRRYKLKKSDITRISCPSGAPYRPIVIPPK